MSKAKVVFAALIAVLAVSAMASSSATAAEGWLIKGTLLAGIAKFSNTASVDEVFVLKFSGTEIICSANILDGMGLQIENPNMASAETIIFAGCAVTSGGECELNSGPRIETLPILTEVTLDGPLAVRGVLKPQKVTTLATINLKGANCAVQGKQPITGTAAWLAPTGQDERTLQLLSVNITEASKEFRVGGLDASLKGSILLKLASSLPWSFM